MTEIKVLNKNFEEVETLKAAVALGLDQINVPVVHQVVKAFLANRRSGTACTKNKSLVSGGGKKPFKQKGTGRARQGSNRSPLMVGGGTAFGPKPRSYEQKINKKVMNKAFLSVLADKLQAGKLFVLRDLPSTGKTKEVNSLLEERKLGSALLVSLKKDDAVVRATKNIRTAYASTVDAVSVYEILKYENLIFNKESFEEFVKSKSWGEAC